MSYSYSKPLFAAIISALFSAMTVGLAGAADLGPTEADKVWLLPDQPPYPADNRPNEARVELGKMLFFDPRLARDGNMSCATCHSPLLGWSDGLSTAKGAKSMVLGRATPTVVNTAYNSI